MRDGVANRGKPLAKQHKTARGTIRFWRECVYNDAKFGRCP